MRAKEFLAKIEELKEKMMIAMFTPEQAEVEKEIDQFFSENRLRILDNLHDAYQAYLDGRLY